jgi:hypothetical protein
MSVRDACVSIMGRELADAIIADQGLHWCVVAAVAGARTTDDPEALAVLREEIKPKGRG